MCITCWCIVFCLLELRIQIQIHLNFRTISISIQNNSKTEKKKKPAWLGPADPAPFPPGPRGRPTRPRPSSSVPLGPPARAAPLSPRLADRRARALAPTNQRGPPVRPVPFLPPRSTPAFLTPSLGHNGYSRGSLPESAPRSPSLFAPHSIPHNPPRFPLSPPSLFIAQ